MRPGLHVHVAFALAIGLLCAGSGCRLPDPKDGGRRGIVHRAAPLPRSTPEAQGVSSGGVLAFLDAVEAESLNLHSLMVVRRGHVVAEGWWSPYEAQNRHTLYSLSKSFTSTAVGLAIGEGRFSLDDRVVDFFPNELPEEISDNLGAMRVRHLLSMSTGHETDALAGLGVGVLDSDVDWAELALAQPVPFAPGTHFLYNNAAPYLLSAIVQRTTGQTMFEYLTPRLFAPLGIAGADWEVSPQGVVSGRSGLRVRTEDLTRFGVLYLNDGVWGGQRLLPEGWVQEATRAQIATGDPQSTEGWPDWAQGYGYFFWRSRNGAFRGDGAFGQFCLVLPDEDAVIVVTAENQNMQSIMDAVWAHLVPERQEDGLAGEPRPPGNDARVLTERLGALSLPVVGGPAGNGTAERVGGRVYEIEPNRLGVERVSLRARGDRWVFTMTDAQGEHGVACGVGEWAVGRTSVSPAPLFLVTTRSTEGPASTIAGSGAWVEENTFRMWWRFVETAHGDTVTCRFDGDKIRVEFRRSLSALNPSDPDPRPVLTGTAR